jgi:type I restriction enzyme S subunit
MNLGQYSMASAQPGISVDKIQQLLLPVPPKSEQKEIADYLDIETAKIDKLITHTTDEIALLKELRAATIADAVLGRIDVRTKQ